MSLQELIPSSNTARDDVQQTAFGYDVLGRYIYNNRQHVARWHEEKRWLLVDEARNEPRPCNAIDAGLLSGDPISWTDLFRGVAPYGFALLV